MLSLVLAYLFIKDFPAEISQLAPLKRNQPLVAMELISEIWKCFHEVTQKNSSISTSSAPGARTTSDSLAKGVDYCCLAKDISDSGQLLVQFVDSRKILAHI